MLIWIGNQVSRLIKSRIEFPLKLLNIALFFTTITVIIISHAFPPYFFLTNILVSSQWQTNIPKVE